MTAPRDQPTRQQNQQTSLTEPSWISNGGEGLRLPTLDIAKGSGWTLSSWALTVVLKQKRRAALINRPAFLCISIRAIQTLATQGNL